MARVLVGQKAVFLLHSGESRFNRRVAARNPPGCLAAIVDPFAEPIGITQCVALRADLG
jgi:hypothetical protein